MSHDRGWRAACIVTLWIPGFHFEVRNIARGVTAMVVGSGDLLGRIFRLQKAHFIVGQISGSQRSARNRNVRLPLNQTGRTRTKCSPRLVPIRALELPRRHAGVEPLNPITPDCVRTQSSHPKM